MNDAIISNVLVVISFVIIPVSITLMVILLISIHNSFKKLKMTTKERADLLEKEWEDEIEQIKNIPSNSDDIFIDEIPVVNSTQIHLHRGPEKSVKSEIWEDDIKDSQKIETITIKD